MSVVSPFSGFVYHPHQLEAIQWMTSREKTDAPMARGGILADEMGLGKTWETIGLLLNSPVPLTLLLVPPMLQPQWSDALSESGISHSVLGSPAKKGEAGVWKSIPGSRSDIIVHLATYDRASNNIDTLVLLPYDRIICDEGHILRNGNDTSRFRNLIRIMAPRRWILSGTPIQNSASDFNNLVKFLGMDATLRLRTPLVAIGAELILRRTVGDVRAAVPSMPTEKPIHVVHPVEIPSGEELRVFSALMGRFEHAVEAHARNNIILELYLRIRQFISHPQIYVDAIKRKYGAAYGRAAWDGTSSKMSAFRGFLDATAKKPTIIFTHFKKEMEYAEIELVASGYRVWKVGGGMTDVSRAKVLSESKVAVEGGNSAVAILIQIVAGGAGLNIQHCNRIVFLSSHWNPAVVDQAIARAYRMGQTDRVEVHHILLADDAEKNLDRYITELHGLKRKVAVGVHEKLFCDSAVSSMMILDELDAAFEAAEEVPATNGGAGGASNVSAEGEDPV